MGAIANSNSKETDSGFVGRLESLRGLAALAVASGHCFLINMPPGPQQTIIKLLLIGINGRAAVSVFFVLSGYVLGLGLRRSRRSFAAEYRAFTIRRVLRIAPALAACTLLAWAYVSWIYQPPTDPTPDIQRCDTYAKHYLGWDWKLIALNFLGFNQDLNPVTWTLRVEVVWALLLPSLHWLSLRLAGGFRLLGILLLIVMCYLSPWRSIFEFGFMFYLGYLLPDYADKARTLFARSTWVPWLGLGITLVLLLPSRYLHGAWLKTGVLLEGLGSAGLILTIVYGGAPGIGRILDHAAARFYGRISYSFYLLHAPLLFACVQFLFPVIPRNVWVGQPLLLGTALSLISIGVASAVAWVFYVYVEKPFIFISRLLCAAWVDRRPMNIREEFWKEYITK